VGFIEGVLQNKISVGRFPFFPRPSYCTKLSFRFLLMMESMMEVNRADSAVSRGGSVRIQHRPPKHPVLSSSSNAAGAAGSWTSAPMSSSFFENSSNR
jgi:hypothetical protein